MSLFSYLIYSPDRRLSQLTLKSELEQIEDNCQVPNHVLFNFSRSISFHIYERFIDIIYLHQSTPSGPQTKRQDNPYQILSVFVWEDLLFYTDLYSVWLCMPTLFDREPLKLKLATVFPHSREPIKPADLTFIVGIVDRQLVLANGQLDLLPVALGSPLLDFYFRVKAGKPRLAFDDAQPLPAVEQEALVRSALFLRQFKLAILFKAFGLVYLKSYKAILREVFQENKEVQYEYVMLFVKLSYQLNQGQRQAMLEELTKYDRQIEENDRLREVLAKIDL